MNEDAARQAEELSVLATLYPQHNQPINCSDASEKSNVCFEYPGEIQFWCGSSLVLLLALELPAGYPSTAAAVVKELSSPMASLLSSTRREEAIDMLRDLAAEALENGGAEVLFQWVQALLPLHEQLRDSLEATRSITTRHEQEQGIDDSQQTVAATADDANAADAGEERDDEHGDVVRWVRGAQMTDRKSKFVGWATQLFDSHDVLAYVQHLKSHGRKVENATHNIGAYRCESYDARGTVVMDEGRFDDGETGAGDNMLSVLRQMEVRNVLVVVTRWYGGVQLGPDRFKHIKTCTRNVVEALFAQVRQLPSLADLAEVYFANRDHGRVPFAPQLRRIAPDNLLGNVDLSESNIEPSFLRSAWPSLQHFIWGVRCRGDQGTVERIRVRSSIDQAQQEYFAHSAHAADDDTLLQEAVTFLFLQHPDLKSLLLATGRARLRWDDQDRHYGCRGKDRLGQIYMRTRDLLN